MRRSIFLFVFCVFASAPTFSQELTLNSGERQIQLIELYTSEGCSSCPPADRWLSRLKTHDRLWKDFVPVAFHVGYWDYIGWKDRFAKHEYAQRQRRYAAEFNESTVYTPGVRLAGQEWRNWFRAGSEIPEAPAKALPGNLSLNISQGGSFKASFSNDLGSEFNSAQLTVAILGQDLNTQVERGENRGRSLDHDFVVLANTTLSSQIKGQEFTWAGTLPSPSVKAGEYAVAAWVSVGGSQKPIQVLGGPLTEDLL